MDLMPRGFGFDDFLDNFIFEKKPEDFNEMKCDIYEKDNEYYIEMDIPGMKKENIKLECEDEYLTIIASSEHKHEEKDKKYIRRERHFGKYQRRFHVGKINPNSIKAEFNDGSLLVSFPKEDKTTRKIAIDIK